MPEQNLVRFAWYHEGYGWVAQTNHLGCYNVDSFEEADKFDTQVEANTFQDKYNPIWATEERLFSWTLHEILIRISRA